MNFLRSILPDYTPPLVANKGELAVLRERILQTILLLSNAVGLLALFLGVKTGIQEQNAVLPLLYGGIYLVAFITLLSRNWNLNIRGNITISTFYILALSELIESGSLGDVRMFLIAYVTLTAILFSYKNIIFSVVLGLLTIAGAGIYVSIVETPIFPAMANIKLGTSWITASSIFLLLSVVLGGSTTVLISGLESNLLKQEELTQSLEYERDALEDRIRERTRSMSRRLVQLHTAAEVSRSISALTEPTGLLQQVVELIKERFDMYYAGVFLLDEPGQNAVLRAGSGEAGRRMLAERHHLSVGGSSMIGWTISNRKARIALDVGAEAVRFNNPNLPLTRSEIALPIIARENVLGAMSVQSTRPNAFDENDITVLQGIADSLGTAMDNDRLYKETRQSLEEIRALNREYIQRSWSETINIHGELTYTFDNPLMVNRTDEGHTIEMPLLLRDEVIGYLTVETEQAYLSSEERIFVDNITNQTAIALENARLLEETERRAIQELKINELATRFSRALSIDEILRAAVQELGQLPSIAEVSVRLAPGGITAQVNSPAVHLGSNGNGKEHAV